LHGDLDQLATQFFGGVTIRATGELKECCALVKADALDGVRLKIRPQVQDRVRREPLGIIGEEFRPKFASYSMRADNPPYCYKARLSRLRGQC
jgi:hypothetical protein